MVSFFIIWYALANCTAALDSIQIATATWTVSDPPVFPSSWHDCHFRGSGLGEG